MNTNLYKTINIKGENIVEEIKFFIGKDESVINIEIYINIDDDFNIYMISPSKTKTHTLSSQSKIIKNIINKTKIKAYINDTYKSISKKIIQIYMKSATTIEPGCWSIVLTPINIISKIKDINIFLLNTNSQDTKILNSREYTSKENMIIDYSKDCMGFSYLGLEKINYRNLLVKNNQNNKVINDREIRDYIYFKDLIKTSIDKFEPRFGVIHDQKFEAEFSKLGEMYKFLNLSEDLGIVFVNQKIKADTKQILKLKGIIRLEEIANMAILGEVRDTTVGGVSTAIEINSSFIKENPNMSMNGKGVLIGIIDTGIDYLHKDFIYPDETSKVVYLWDQTKEGNNPKGYFFGAEYTREDINEAIKNNDYSLSQDEIGHGTMISGICAGMGNINEEYVGISQEAELVVVKLAKINGYYNNVTLATAIQYIYQKAIELNLPVVINIPFGSNLSIGLNSRLLFNDKIFPYLTRGFFLVAGAGNEGNTSTHTMGRLQYNGEVSNIEIEVGEDEEHLEIQILASKPDKILVSIVSPTGEESKRVEVVNYGEITGIFDLERSMYKITYIYPTAYSGQQESRVRITNARKGIWKIRLYGEYIIDGVYHLFLPNRVFLNKSTKFREPNPDFTINFPANLKEILAIGVYDSINKGVWSMSSRGPTVSNISKPDILAPGVNIIAPYPGNKYGVITGSSASAAHTTGALALYLQYTLVDEIYPDRAFIQQARTYLQAGAYRTKDRVYPNNSYGYGLLNIKGLFEQLE